MKQIFPDLPKYNTFCERSVLIQQPRQASTRHPLLKHVDVTPLLKRNNLFREMKYEKEGKRELGDTHETCCYL
jgi:hypothetical protein